MSTVFDTITPPVPDPDVPAKTAEEMVDEGDREGPVLTDGSRPEDDENDPQFARNGE